MEYPNLLQPTEWSENLKNTHAYIGNMCLQVFGWHPLNFFALYQLMSVIEFFFALPDIDEATKLSFGLEFELIFVHVFMRNALVTRCKETARRALTAIAMNMAADRLTEDHADVKSYFTESHVFRFEVMSKVYERFGIEWDEGDIGEAHQIGLFNLNKNAPSQNKLSQVRRLVSDDFSRSCVKKPTFTWYLDPGPTLIAENGIAPIRENKRIQEMKRKVSAMYDQMEGNMQPRRTEGIAAPDNTNGPWVEDPPSPRMHESMADPDSPILTENLSNTTNPRVDNPSPPSPPDPASDSEVPSIFDVHPRNAVDDVSDHPPPVPRVPCDNPIDPQVVRNVEPSAAAAKSPRQWKGRRIHPFASLRIEAGRKKIRKARLAREEGNAVRGRLRKAEVDRVIQIIAIESAIKKLRATKDYLDSCPAFQPVPGLSLSKINFILSVMGKKLGEIETETVSLAAQAGRLCSVRGYALLISHHNKYFSLMLDSISALLHRTNSFRECMKKGFLPEDMVYKVVSDRLSRNDLFKVFGGVVSELARFLSGMIENLVAFASENKTTKEASSTLQPLVIPGFLIGYYSAAEGALQKMDKSVQKVFFDRVLPAEHKVTMIRRQIDQVLADVQVAY